VVKKLVIEIVLQILLATDNINQNVLLEYFFVVDMFDSLIHVRFTNDDYDGDKIVSLKQCSW